jgi:hypothetical protein
MDPYWNWDIIQLTDACIHHAPDDDPNMQREQQIKWKQMLTR